MNLDEMIEAYAEGQLDEAGQERLLALLKEDEEARKKLARRLEEKALMVAALARLPVIAAASSLWLRKGFLGLLLVAATAAGLWAALRGPAQPLPPLPPAAPRKAAETPANPPPPTARILKLPAEFQELRQEDGTLLQSRGPARLSFHAAQEASLDDGRLLIQAPQAGLVLKLPRFQIVNLGATFIVDARADHQACQVLSGKIRISAGSQVLELSEKQACQIGPAGLASCPFDLRHFGLPEVEISPLWHFLECAPTPDSWPSPVLTTDWTQRPLSIYILELKSLRSSDCFILGSIKIRGPVPEVPVYLQIDDALILHINGKEVTTVNLTPERKVKRVRSAQTAMAELVIPPESLRVGDNPVAAQVLQAKNSKDMFFDMKLKPIMAPDAKHQEAPEEKP